MIFWQNVLQAAGVFLLVLLAARAELNQVVFYAKNTWPSNCP
jgi:hypothetical protein